jgi:cell division protein FtsW
MKESTKIAIIVFSLLCLGLVMVYSTSAIYANEKYNDSMYFFKKCVVFTLLSLLGLMIGYYLNYRILGKLSPYIFMLTFISLFLVFTPLGLSAGGARRWVNLFAFSFQPSEIMKYTAIIFLSSFLAKHLDNRMSLWQFFVPAVFIIGLCVFPVFLEPDFGTTFLIGSVSIILLVVAGARLRYIAFIFFMTLPAIFMAVIKASYRLKRVLVFVDPWKEAQSTGYQIIQSFIAIQTGGLTGLGLGESRQKLFYLPEAHTDFIFSIIGEELGFVGTMVILLFFFFFIYFGLKIAVKAHNPFGKFVAVGIVTMIGFQAFLNMGVVTGLLPTKGLPLPFISYGGTNLIMTMFAVGILMNIERQAIPKTVNDMEMPKVNKIISKYTGA